MSEWKLTIDVPDQAPIVARPRPHVTTVLGVAVGDYTAAPALIAVRYDAKLIKPADPLFGEAPIFETQYTVLGAEKLSVGLSYPAVASRINTLARRLYDRDSRGDYHVLIDATGVGRPVIRATRDSVIPQCSVTGVTITSGDKGDLSLLWRQEATTGLAYLISRLQAIVQGNRLHMPAEPLYTALVQQLRIYEVKIDAGPDLVRALALACCNEYSPVRYDLSLDAVSSPVL